MVVLPPNGWKNHAVVLKGGMVRSWEPNQWSGKGDYWGLALDFAHDGLISVQTYVRGKLENNYPIDQKGPIRDLPVDFVKRWLPPGQGFHATILANGSK